VIAFVRGLIIVALVAASARAETVVELPKSKAMLRLADGWKRIGQQSQQAVLEIFTHDKGHVLAVTRADVPNPDAWVKDKKQAYADRVERGIKSKVPGYKRLAKKLVDANGIPALDVEAKRNDGAVVVVRVLLFRTYAISAAVEVPKGGDLKVARDVVKSFAPPKESEPALATPPKGSG
jgi:hypothetical protein